MKESYRIKGDIDDIYKKNKEVRFEKSEGKKINTWGIDEENLNFKDLKTFLNKIFSPWNNYKTYSILVSIMFSYANYLLFNTWGAIFFPLVIGLSVRGKIDFLSFLIVLIGWYIGTLYFNDNLPINLVMSVFF